MSLTACDKGKDAAPVQTAAASASAPASQPLKLPLDDAPPALVDGDHAMQYAKEIVKFGPRPLASANHKRVEEYISSHLKSDQVEDDIFTADTPEGKFPVHNIVAKYTGTKDGIIIIASHYDTNYPLRNTPYVGANDGASSSGLLLELANHLRGRQREGYSIWLVWDDAEEAIKPDGSGGQAVEAQLDLIRRRRRRHAGGPLVRVGGRGAGADRRDHCRVVARRR